MNNRWRRAAELKGWDNIIGITTNKSNEILMYNDELDDYKCVAWADDFKLRSKGFRKGAKHYATKR
ncbi:MAG TPA: hypothetical protein K8V24_07885 [Limosilactobacillus reuteri]|nr:hypothetical protein [Limosilactobacillus reuteri]